jgi:hypothetical protein
MEIKPNGAIAKFTATAFDKRHLTNVYELRRFAENDRKPILLTVNNNGGIWSLNDVGKVRFEELAKLSENGLGSAVLSNSGLTVPKITIGNQPSNWEEERSLLLSWQEMGLPAQLSPYFERDYDCDSFRIADRLLEWHPTLRFGSHWLKVPVFDTKKDYHKPPLAGSLEITFLGWFDMAHIAGESAVDLPALICGGHAKRWPAEQAGAPTAPDNAGEPPKLSPTVNDHDEVLTLLRNAGWALNGGKVLVLNYDAHHDFGYDSLEHPLVGNWAHFAQKEGLARVVHIPSYFYDSPRNIFASRSEINWNTPARRDSISKEIAAILSGEKIRQVWLTIDFDAFSLRQMDRYDEAIVKVYHFTSKEAKADLLSLKDFLAGCGMKIDLIAPCSSVEWLNLPLAKIPSWVERIEGTIREVFS